MAQATLPPFDYPVVLSPIPQLPQVTLTLSAHTLPHLRLLPEGVGHIHCVTEEMFTPYVGYYERTQDVVELTVELLSECRYTDEYGRVILDWLPELIPLYA